MVKAILFDCFGVLTSDGWIPFKRRHFAHDPQLNQQATDLNKQANAGFIDAAAFIKGIAELADVPQQQVRRVLENNVADEDLFEYIRTTLRPHYKLGMLSNAGANMLGDLFTSRQIDMFDEIALSFETGHVKPEQQAYEQLAGRLGVEPGECIFVDDQERHCAGAEAAGMRAIVYKDFEQFKAQLEPLLTSAD